MRDLFSDDVQWIGAIAVSGIWAQGTPPSDLSGQPTAGLGASQTFIFTADSLNGGSAISFVEVLFEWNLLGPGGCWAGLAGYGLRARKASAGLSAA